MNGFPQPQWPVVVLDDEAEILNSMEMVLESMGITNIKCFMKSEDFLAYFKVTERITTVLLDLMMPGINGMDVLTQIKERQPSLPVIIVSGESSVEKAIRCMKIGAYDYLVKPLKPDEVISSVKRAVEYRQLQLDKEILRDSIFAGRDGKHDAFEKVLTANEKMYIMFNYIEAIAGSRQPVLITGETGTGKELIAEGIHRAGGKSGKFIKLNTAGTDDTFFADTLFGHESGAFTGASKKRKGLIEEAADGTLFLDEIGDLKSESQVKLLRLLEDREYLPLGSDHFKRSCARILLATNRNLEELMARGLFRRDLYYRISTYHVHLPPLRERKCDLPLLFKYFLSEACTESGKKVPLVPDEVFKALSLYSFPGNIRELRGLVFDAVSHSKGGTLGAEPFKNLLKKISLDSAPPDILPFFNQPGSFNQDIASFPTLKQAEELLIAQALELAQNNQSIAAGLLGISRQALNRRLLSKKSL